MSIARLMERRVDQGDRPDLREFETNKAAPLDEMARSLDQSLSSSREAVDYRGSRSVNRFRR